MADTPADFGAEKGPSPAPTRRDSQAAEKVSRACDNCSKSKSKCLLRPGSKTCENCRFLEVACTFNRTVKKRGPPKGYVNTLEQRLASLESIVTELQGGYVAAADNSPEELPLPTPNTNNGHNQSKRRGQEEDLDYQTMSQQRLPMPPKPLVQKVDSSSEKSTVLGYLSIDENMTMRYHGPTSGLYLMTASRVFASPFWQFSNPGFWPRSKNTTFRTEDEIVSAADAILGGILPSLAVQNKLLDAFWAYVHPYFPIVHKETFLFQLSKDRRGIPRQGRSALDQLERRIPQVLLLSMFALSARFVENRGGREDSDPGDEHATKAETLIAQHKQSSINCCLALLMMAYREIGTGGSISWMYVGNAIRMSQDLGLHRDPSVWKNTNCFRNMSTVEIQIRRLIWWGAFVLDRYIAAWQGRPCAIHEDDFDTQLPDDSPHGTRDVSLACFSQVIKLSIIQGRIHREFYSVGSKGPDWSKLHEFENSLNEWEVQIPDFLGIRQGVRLPVPVIVMHSQFWNCKVLLHRPFITHNSNEPQTNNSSLLAATSAAVAIANLLEHFTSSYSASFAPPFFNYYSFTAIIMHLFNRAVYPVLFSPSALTHCTDCCRKMSSIWSSAVRTLHIVEGVDHEIDNILPGSTSMYAAATTGNQPVASTSASASGPSSGMTAVLDTQDHTGADDQDAANFCFTSWPSPIVDPDWLSLETWRANGADVDELRRRRQQYLRIYPESLNHDSKDIDDAPSILQAFDICGNNGKVIFTNNTFNVNSVLNTTNLVNCDVSLQGELKFSINITYWRENVFSVIYQNQSTAWLFGGENGTLRGEGGWINGNGQTWYTWYKNKGNQFGRPISISFFNSTNLLADGLTILQPQFWATLVWQSQNVSLANFFVNATSNDEWDTTNTDGYDSWRSDNLRIENATITNGDDCIAAKGNTTNLLVRNVTCHSSAGITIGSIGQYPDWPDYVQNITFDNVHCLDCADGAYIKTWQGVPTDHDSNGDYGGGGGGLVKNVTFSNFNLEHVGLPIQISQCLYSEPDSKNCNISKLQIEDVSWVNFTGTSRYNIAASLYCSDEVPCPGIKFDNVSIQSVNETLGLPLWDTTLQYEVYQCMNIVGQNSSGIPCNYEAPNNYSQSVRSNVK